jgi:hypothetical protein
MSVEIQLSENATEAERLGILTPLLAHNLANGGHDAHENLPCCYETLTVTKL